MSERKKTGKASPPRFTDDEVLRLTKAATGGLDEVAEADLVAIHEWAYKVRIEAAMLELAMRGDWWLRWRDGKIVFVRSDAP